MMIRRLGAFRLGRRLVRVWRWVLKRPHKRYLRIRFRSKSQSLTGKIIHWTRCFTRKLGCSGGDYYRPGTHTGGGGRLDLPLLVEEGAAKPPPKGHLAVYVGGSQEGDPTRRYLVPVIYFNHPLFGELLREAEAEFGYQHPGGITIPCPVSRFEQVRTRIAAGRKGVGVGVRVSCY